MVSTHSVCSHFSNFAGVIIPTIRKPTLQVSKSLRLQRFLISLQTCLFSLAATLWSAADWRLTEAEKPSLSTRFQELLASMTDDCPDARPGLYDVLQVSCPNTRMVLSAFSMFCSSRSINVCGKLLTYPSPKLTLTLTSHLGQKVA